MMSWIEKTWHLKLFVIQNIENSHEILLLVLCKKFTGTEMVLMTLITKSCFRPSHDMRKTVEDSYAKMQ